MIESMNEISDLDQMPKWLPHLRTTGTEWLQLYYLVVMNVENEELEENLNMTYDIHRSTIDD
jgi:hypothetical protein